MKHLNVKYLMVFFISLAVFIITCKKLVVMENHIDVDGILTFSQLLLMRDKDNPEYLHNYFKESKFWRSNYKSLKNKIPESLSWFKDKQLSKPIDADSVDIISYVKPASFTSVLLFRTKDKQLWENLKETASKVLQLKNVQNLNGVIVFIYQNDKYYVKMADASNVYSTVIMSRRDYERGLNIN